MSGDSGIINQIEFQGRSFAGASVSNYGIVNNGDVVYTKSPLKANPFGIIKTNKGKPGIVSTLYAVYKPNKNTNSNFVQYYFDYDYRLNKYLKPLVNKGAKNDMKVSDDNALAGLVIFPSYEEQTRVAEFLECLDNLIALYQDKRKKLGEIKRAYLDLIFSQKIRFSSFSEEWELRNLDSLVDRIKSYSLSRDVETNEYTGYKYIHYGDIHTKVADIIDESSNLPNIKAGNYEILEKGDVVLADASEDYQGIATPAVITIDLPYKLVSGLHTIALRPKHVDSIYLYYLFNSPIFRKYGYKTGTGMKVFGISVTNLLKFESMIPSLEEQIKIGKFFKKLDENIVLHEKKLMKLNELKKAYLQKMFV